MNCATGGWFRASTVTDRVVCPVAPRLSVTTRRTVYVPGAGNVQVVVTPVRSNTPSPLKSQL